MSNLSQADAMRGHEQPPQRLDLSWPGNFVRSVWFVNFFRGFSWVREKVRTQQALKTLKVRETVSLGDKRFVAVVQVDQERFLIGGGAGSVNMLARLEPNAFQQALQNSNGSGVQA